MLYRVDRPFVHKRDTGFFLQADMNDTPEIGGHCSQYRPIIAELWRVFHQDFALPKRGSMRLAFLPESRVVYAKSYTLGKETGSIAIHFNDVSVTHARLSIQGDREHTIPIKIVSVGKEHIGAYVVMGNYRNHTYLSINPEIGVCLNEIGLSAWDIGLINLTYTPQETI